MNNLVDIYLHGDLGEKIGQKYKLAVDSVSEAIHAINTMKQGRLYKYLYENDKKNQRYKVLINKRPFVASEQLNLDNPKTILNSELVAKNKNLKSIDIVPVIEGADEGIISTILGVVLIIVGVILLHPEVVTIGVKLLAAAAIVAGISLVAGGIIMLLSSPPKFEDFREIDGKTGRTSYLFNGPENTTREGGPVPIGYGRLLVGSQVISAAYIINEYNAGYLTDLQGNIITDFSTLGGGGGGGSKNPIQKQYIF